MTSVSSRMLLQRMEEARRQTQHHFDRIERQIAGRAERLTITQKAKARSHRRGRANWTRSDEQLYREHHSRLSFERRNEIAALSRKLGRQDRAIAALRGRRSRDASGGAAEGQADRSVRPWLDQILDLNQGW